MRYKTNCLKKHVTVESLTFCCFGVQLTPDCFGLSLGFASVHCVNSRHLMSPWSWRKNSSYSRNGEVGELGNTVSCSATKSELVLYDWWLIDVDWWSMLSWLMINDWELIVGFDFWWLMIDGRWLRIDVWDDCDEWWLVIDDFMIGGWWSMWLLMAVFHHRRSCCGCGCLCRCWWLKLNKISMMTTDTTGEESLYGYKMLDFWQSCLTCMFRNEMFAYNGRWCW